MGNEKCPIYEKHHNTIDGVYMLRLPNRWEDIPMIDSIDAVDDDGSLLAMFKDLNVYDISELEGFEKPCDKHNVEETIFIIQRNGIYYLCETQGENYIKFSTNISKVSFVEQFDRKRKIVKLQEKSSNKSTIL